ncbi:uncharacterized protein EV154DRAFT_489044, partial [Mucor mucedo]|uniref:uncharacterized protein n=1 Tax=Mucor mucedo TaxID=29922 RepID=UPI0022207968
QMKILEITSYQQDKSSHVYSSALKTNHSQLPFSWLVKVAVMMIYNNKTFAVAIILNGQTLNHSLDPFFCIWQAHIFLFIVIIGTKAHFMDCLFIFPWCIGGFDITSTFLFRFVVVYMSIRYTIIMLGCYFSLPLTLLTLYKALSSDVDDYLTGSVPKILSFE